MKLCECGCGRAIVPKPTHKYKPAKFLLGHMSKATKAGRKSRPRYVPPPESIPSGICECGCGNGPTGIAPRTEKGKRWFLDHHVPYLPGHSPKQLGPNNHRWNGGRSRTVHGYIVLHMPDHPHADVKGYVREHRHVWEQANGRILESHEHIHHINGIKDDNRLENLVMLTKWEHGKHHGSERMAHARALHPDMLSKGGKASAAIKWKGHIKKSKLNVSQN